MSTKTIDYVITPHQVHLSKTTKHWDGFVSHCNYSPGVPLKPKTREGWGLQHDVCGQLLAPIEFDWDDDEYDLFLPQQHAF
jgi:hypothetical protein